MPKNKLSLTKLAKELKRLKERVEELEKKTKYCDGASLPADACGPMDD